MKLTFAQQEFATSHKDLVDAFLDYWNHYRAINPGDREKKTFEYDTKVSFEEKESIINKLLIKEVIKRSGVPYAAEEPIDKWFWHPNIIHETFAIVGALIDMVLPQSIIDTIGVYSSVKVGGWGDSFKFDIKPRDLFSVSLAGKRQKRAEINKQFTGTKTVVPEFREITVGVSMYRVLAGIDSLADLTAKALLSIETQMAVDVYNLFFNTMVALDSTALTGLYVAGYTQDALVDLAQRVTAWNGGAKATIVGTQRALVQVFPDDVNYRYDIESDYVKLGYLKTAFGYDLLALPQVVDVTNPFAVKLSNSYLWLISPMQQKLIHLCLEGSMLSNSETAFDKADLSQSTTFIKAWGVVLATGAVAGTLSLP